MVIQKQTHKRFFRCTISSPLVKPLPLTCSLLQKLGDGISRCRKFQRFFVWICGWTNGRGVSGRKHISRNYQRVWSDGWRMLWSKMMLQIFFFRYFTVIPSTQSQLEVTLTFGGDHQLTGQSQRGHRVLVNQSREAAYRQQVIPPLNQIMALSRERLTTQTLTEVGFVGTTLETDAFGARLNQEVPHQFVGHVTHW